MTSRRFPGADPRHADVVLVGLGGAGAVAAHVLTRAGAEVLVLEAGSFVRATESRFDEVENDIRARLARPKALGELPTFRRSPAGRAGASPWPMAMGNGVGGSTTHYPGPQRAACRHGTSQSRSSTIARYGRGRLPVDSDARRLAARVRRPRAVLRKGRAGDRRCRRCREPVRRAAEHGLSAATAPALGLEPAHRCRCPTPGLESVSGSGGDQLRTVRRSGPLARTAASARTTSATSTRRDRRMPTSCRRRSRPVSYGSRRVRG